jgi:hypothetical protein
MKEENEFEQQNETTKGVKINVEDLGGTGKPVVFIHG